MTRNMDEGRAHPGGATESTYTCCTPALDTQPTHAPTDTRLPVPHTRANTRAPPRCACVGPHGAESVEGEEQKRDRAEGRERRLPCSFCSVSSFS